MVFFKKKYNLDSTLAIDLGFYGEVFEDLIDHILQRLNLPEKHFYLLFNKKNFNNPYGFRFELETMFYNKKTLHKKYKNKKFLTILDLIEMIAILQENINAIVPVEQQK